MALVLSTLSETSQAELFRRAFFGRPSSFQNSGFRNNFVINDRRFERIGSNRFNNSLSPNNFFKPTGFSNLVQVGNRLIERSSTGQLRDLTIDAGGRLLGATEAKTVRQLREFFLDNLNKFQGNALNTVRRFLAANGGLSDGKFVIDLTNIIVSKNAAVQGRECEAAVKTLNFILNSLQFRRRIVIPTARACPRGQVEVDLSRFFDQQTLAYIKLSDPTSACTGKIRLDAMATFLMDPVRYYEITNIPNEEKDLYKIVGGNDDQTQSFQNKMLILNRESGVSPGFQRVIERQTARNILVGGQRPGACYRSLDTFDFTAQGERANSRSVQHSGVFFERDASEILCTGANGFQFNALYDAAGKRQNEAPGSIANGAIHPGAAVRAGISCFGCHIDGYITAAANVGGRNNRRRTQPYGDYQARVGELFEGGLGRNTPTNFRLASGQALTHGDYFVGPQTMGRIAQQDSNAYIQAQELANARMTDTEGNGIPLLADMVTRFNDADGVDAATAAKQLGVSETQALSIIRSISGGKDKVGRTSFESRYCNLRAGNTSSLREEQAREALRRDSARTLDGLRQGVVSH